MRRPAVTIIVATLLGSLAFSACAGEREPSPTARQSHSPTADPSEVSPPESLPSPRVPETLVRSRDFAMLPAGRPPRIPYVFGRHTLAAVGRPPRALPAPLGGISALARLRHGWLIASTPGSEGPQEGSPRRFASVTLVDEALDPVWTRVGADRFATNGRGTSLAYFTVAGPRGSAGQLMLAAANGKPIRRWTFAPNELATPIGITSRGLVVYNLLGPHGRSRGSWLTGSGSAAPRRLGLSVRAASGDLVAGSTNEGCQVVLRDEAELWRRCAGFQLVAFSPNGRYVAGFHTATGAEFEEVYVFDALTGRRVSDTTANYTSGFRGLPAGHLAWEDNLHLLLPYRAPATAVLRLGMNGKLERATGALRRSSGELPFVFGTTP